SPSPISTKLPLLLPSILNHPDDSTTFCDLMAPSPPTLHPSPVLSPSPVPV
ncbi:hypothetical protein HMI54_009805, partial [Coelomomyces lativittatus]